MQQLKNLNWKNVTHGFHSFQLPEILKRRTKVELFVKLQLALTPVANFCSSSKGKPASVLHGTSKSETLLPAWTLIASCYYDSFSGSLRRNINQDENDLQACSKCFAEVWMWWALLLLVLEGSPKWWLLFPGSVKLTVLKMFRSIFHVIWRLFSSYFFSYNQKPFML